VFSPMKVKDPVCGMIIESTTAKAHSTYGNETVYFCAVACQTQYEKTHPHARA
jgi:YHS domain-containing protein